MKLNKVIIGIWIVLAIIVVAIIASSTPKTYSNDEYGFSIVPPTGWKTKENVKIGNFTSVVAFIGPKENDFTVNFNIYSESTKGLNLQEYVNLGKEASASIPSFNLISEKNRTIKNLEGYELVYTINLMNKSLEFEQMILIKNGESYVITFASLKDNFDKYISDFEKSTETFKFL
jgi:hypothetical protein